MACFRVLEVRPAYLIVSRAILTLSLDAVPYHAEASATNWQLRGDLRIAAVQRRTTEPEFHAERHQGFVGTFKRVLTENVKPEKQVGSGPGFAGSVRAVVLGKHSS